MAQQRRTGPTGPAAGAKGKSGAALRRVIGLMLKNHGLQLALVLACIVAVAVVQVIGSIFTGAIIDDYIVPLASQQTPDFAPLAGRLAQLAAIFLIAVVCSYAYNRIMVSVSQGTMRALRVELFSRMEQLPIAYFDTHPHGDIMSVYTNDVDTLRQLLSQSLPQLASSVITIVATFVSMLALSWQMTLLTVVTVAVMMSLTKNLAGKAGAFFSAQQSDLGNVNGYIEEMIEGQRVIKVFCHEDQAIADFRDLNERLRHSAVNANSYANMIRPIMSNLGNISYVLCAVAGALIAIFGGGILTLGNLVSFLTLNRNFTAPIMQVSQQFNAVVMAAAGAVRVFELMDVEAEKDEGYVELVNARREGDRLVECEERTGIWAWRHHHRADGTTDYRELRGDVVFEDVDFGYRDDKMVLHDISLYAQPGQKIALVGSTGAGKTTITNLINRFYDIQRGKIRYDGINVEKIKKADLRRSLGIVLQDTRLFTGSVLENIRYGRLDATDEECMAAARLACADGFIRRLPEGYQTQITGDGGSLSQGQRQLIAIARAAVADPPVLILDEATSSIDTRTEALVQRGMDALMAGRTSFVIAHRLSTIRNADCIMVMENGRIIERGAHDDLIGEQGRYWQLYTGGLHEDA